MLPMSLLLVWYWVCFIEFKGIVHPYPKLKFAHPQAIQDVVKSSHLYLYSAFNNTDCDKALNSIKLEDRVSVMYNNKIKHSIFS